MFEVCFPFLWTQLAYIMKECSWRFGHTYFYLPTNNAAQLLAWSFLLPRSKLWAWCGQLRLKWLSMLQNRIWKMEHLYFDAWTRKCLAKRLETVSMLSWTTPLALFHRNAWNALNFITWLRNNFVLATLQQASPQLSWLPWLQVLPQEEGWNDCGFDMYWTHKNGCSDSDFDSGRETEPWSCVILRERGNGRIRGPFCIILMQHELYSYKQYCLILYLV